MAAILDNSVSSISTKNEKYRISDISELQIEQDTEPYVLIDMSGSTYSSYDAQVGASNVLDMERMLAYHTLKNANIDKANIIFWDSTYQWIKVDGIEMKMPVDIKYLLSDTTQPSGGTYLSKVLNALTYNESKSVHDVYIFTDGETCDNSSCLEKELQRLFQNNVKLHIYTIETNRYDYLNANCNVGNTLFRQVRDMKMTSNIFEFVCHNEHHGLTNGFRNYYNPRVPADHVLFRNNVIHKNDIVGLLKLLQNLDIGSMSELELKKVTYDLINTVCQLTKGKSITISNEIISLIAKVFVNTPVQDTIFDTLVNDVTDVKNGGVKTYHEYRNAKTNRNEKAQLSLFENVKKSISPNNDVFISFPVATTQGKYIIFTINGKDVTETLYVRNKTFAEGCFKIQNRNVPVLPMNCQMGKAEVVSCIRRWICSVYFLYKPHCNSEDMVLYQFLVDMLCIYLSDLDENIKSAYVGLAKIVLQEIRDNSDETEYDYLLKNKPSLVYGGEQAFNNLMKYCMKVNGIAGTSVGLVWYAILIALDDQRLLTFHKDSLQHVFEHESVRVGLELSNADNLISYLKEHVVTKKYMKKELCNLAASYEYTCYITRDSTLESGGYSILPHELAPGIVCRPKYVIKKEIYDAMDDEYKVCPICNVDLSANNLYRFVPPPRTESTEDKEDEFTLAERAFICNTHEIVTIPDDMVNYIEDDRLELIDTLDFSTLSYEFNKPTIDDSLNSKRIAITKTEDFNTMAGYRYPFLSKINFDNMIIGGGFCRSILLKQRAKDIDFFFHGLAGNEEYINRFRTALQELTSAVYNHYNELDKGLAEEGGPKHNIKFMAMFKPLFNVFEVVCIKDPNNFITEGFTLKHFDKYRFSSLHTLNEHVVIDVKKNTVTTDDKHFIENELDSLKKDMLSNYFEDNDKSGVSMMHRFQFVLAKYTDKLDVLNHFDMYPSRVCYDGKVVEMTTKGHFAYKYMANILCEKGYSTMYDSRISKYFSYGFSIVMAPLDINKIPVPQNRIILNDLKFNIHTIENNKIIVEHDSNLEDKLKSNAKLERHCKEQGISLYKSAMFCSLVSVCRYAEVNKIDYIFTNSPMINDGLEFKFAERTLPTNFVDHIVSRIHNYDWYGKLRLTDATNNSNMTFADKIDTALNAINDLAEGGKIVIYGSEKVNGYCNAFKIDQGIAFVGPSSKLLAKQYMLKNNEYVSLTQELHKITGVRQFICRKSVDHIEQNAYSYEILLEGKLMKPYLDIEWNEESGEAFNESEFLQRLKDDIVTIFANHYNKVISGNDIYMLSSSVDKLRSYHVIINAKVDDKTLVFENNSRIAANSAYSLCYYLMQHNSEYVEKLDWRVYSSDREFRMLNSYKSPSDKRQLIALDNVNDWRDYLVTYVDTNNVEILSSKIGYNKYIKKNKVSKVRRDIPDSVKSASIR
jgi:hypothetical protein